MREFPEVFPASQIALVRAASQAGLNRAGDVYKRLAARLQSDGRLGNKVAAAMAYPATLLGMSVLASAILELKALPPMVELFRSMGAPLPEVTRMFYETARLITDHAIGFGALAGVAAVCLAIIGPRLFRAPASQRLLLRLWYLGSLVQARALSRALSTFVLLKQSGVCTREIFALSAEASGNAAIADFFKMVYRRVAQGEDLGEAFLAERHMLGTAGVRLAGKMEVGLDTGELPELLESLAVDLQDQAENQAALLPRALELPMLVLCGLIVGSIMVAMFLPYPSLLGDVARQMRPGG
jgi:type II secretory pathway component PulF